MDVLFEGHKWVNTMHIFFGPLLAVIAYLAYALHFENKFSEYRSLIQGLLIAQIVIGIGVTLYHSYLLAQKNNFV